MNSIVEARVKNFLSNWMQLSPLECGTITRQIRKLALVSGHDLDDRFAGSGLGSGPEASVASTIVDRATLGGGCSTSDYEVRAHCNKWLRESSPGIE